MAKTTPELKVDSDVSITEEGVEYKGKVTAIDGELYTVVFDDGDEGEYPIGDIKVIPKAPAKTTPQLSKQEQERKAEIARKAKVDADNQKRAKDAAEAEVKLADTPLSDEEKAFIALIRPKMKMGRPVDQPSPADITRYARLLKREKV